VLTAEGSRGRGALAGLVFGGAQRQAAAAASVDASNGWDDFVGLAARWRVLETARRRLETMEGVPNETRRRLHELSAAASAHSALTLHHAYAASALLENDGIATLAVKGVAAIVQLYATPAARLVSDFDCFIAEKDAREAERVLLAAGFACENVPFDAHMRDIEMSPRLHNLARTYTRDGFELDVHWRLGSKPPRPLRTQTLFERSSTIALRGKTLRVPHPVDAQLLTVHHAMRSSFSPSTTLKDLTDLAAWWERKPDAWEPRELIVAAIESGLGASLLALWQIVVTRDPAHPAAAGARELNRTLSPAQRREAERLHKFFEAQLTRGDYATRTTELFSPQLLANRAIAGMLGQPAQPALRATFGARGAGFLRRSWRIACELADVRQLRAYAAVARAQRRFR
jgi:hypothetical protein